MHDQLKPLDSATDRTTDLHAGPCGDGFAFDAEERSLMLTGLVRPTELLMMSEPERDSLKLIQHVGAERRKIAPPTPSQLCDVCKQVIT